MNTTTRTLVQAQKEAEEALVGRLVKVTPELTGLDKARPYLLRVTRVDVVSATSGVVHVFGDKVRLDGTPSREKRPTKAATFMPGWESRIKTTAPAKPRTLRRDSLDYGYVTSDGRYEITPIYGLSIRGGSVSRPTSWRLADRQGEFEPSYQLSLSRIRDILKERP